MMNWLDEIKWNQQGLLPAIAQELDTGEVLMMAWMNREALKATVEEKRAVYFSRSRGRLWRKGEDSGHVQHLKELWLDCDHDTILLKVEQVGGIACHTGRASCFYKRLDNDIWKDDAPVLKSPDEIYGKGEN
ncbi:MAG: phosphoribosyl-AMP cyclohydrolase [Pseudomonadota bacterium]